MNTCREKNRLLLASICCLLWAAASAHAVVVRVDAAQAGPEDGTTWATAFNTIQEGVYAAAGGGGGEVWVAAGTYDEARTSLIAGVDSGSVLLVGGVDVYGGFDGTETVRAQRDWSANRTIIDGATSRGGQPAYHVVFGAQGVVLDGFEITGGSALAVPGAIDIHSVGGGLCAYGASMTAMNCLFYGNEAVYGGGIAVVSAGGTYEYCDMWDNEGTVGAGGAFAFNASPAFIDCFFDTNIGQYSGGIDVWLGAPTFQSCSFFWNEGTYGGGAFIWSATPQFDDCTFDSNVGLLGAGSVFNYLSDTAYTACYFYLEEGYYGGVMSNWSCSPTFTNCVMETSSAHIGGAIFNADAGGTVLNCTLADNTAAAAGGAIFNDTAPHQLTITNSILYYNLPHQIYDAGPGDLTVTYSLIEGGWAGTGNITDTPLFGAAYQLLPGSPGVDDADTSAAPATDLLGVSRPQGDEADMGAYELEP